MLWLEESSAVASTTGNEKPLPPNVGNCTLSAIVNLTHCNLFVDI